MTAAPLLAFQADPPSDRPVLLLIHGMLSSDMQWQPNSALSRQFRVIRVDLPGHGASAPPMTPAQAQPEAMVAGLEQVRHDLGIACWHVCGASFGAGIALRYALDHPRVCQSVSFTNGNAASAQVGARRTCAPRPISWRVFAAGGSGRAINALSPGQSAALCL